MSRRITCLVLAAAALITTPAVAEPWSHARASRHMAYYPPQPAVTPIARPMDTGVSRSRHAGTTTVIVEPWPLTDPAWQLCQIDGPAGRTYLCGPYSYHPFGAYGHRPFGTYRPERAAPGYVVAPRARVIRLQRDD